MKGYSKDELVDVGKQENIYFPFYVHIGIETLSKRIIFFITLKSTADASFEDIRISKLNPEENGTLLKGIWLNLLNKVSNFFAKCQ
uniref:Uncharacterized protein n=1 Tax=Megaselia scalaris TaxID=36166 RepID=T1GW46_MEGSC